MRYSEETLYNFAVGSFSLMGEVTSPSAYFNQRPSRPGSPLFSFGQDTPQEAEHVLERAAESCRRADRLSDLSVTFDGRIVWSFSSCRHRFPDQVHCRHAIKPTFHIVRGASSSFALFFILKAKRKTETIQKCWKSR